MRVSVNGAFLELVLLYCAIALVIGLYALAAIIVKWHFYPGVARHLRCEDTVRTGGTLVYAVAWWWQTFLGEKRPILRPLVPAFFALQGLALARLYPAFRVA
jgi:hypothetical protein